MAPSGPSNLVSTSASPMTSGDHVKAIHVFAERNPRPLVASFHLGPQSGRAEITTRVQSVSANGDLVIHGSQSIVLNGETQHIEVSGVARPIDVSADNVVLSTRLSNAEIEFSGKGFVDRSQREGFISRLLDALGL